MSQDLGLGVVVSMKDAFSQNAGRVESSMRSLDATVAASSERMTRNMDRIQKGAMLMGAGLSLMALPVGLVASTAATQKALGELASLGVRDLRAIEDAAESFTNTWAGSSKAEFITAAYDVRSALSGLTDEAVGSFTAMAALTGKATKATTEEMVGTFTTAYGIFKPIMAESSDAEWARTFAGAMAQTVASFKTNGRQMADAIKNIGAVAAANNVPLQEQLAILGQLQTTMPGSEAGTLYKAFIMKAAEAGEKLGLELVDASGRLKGVVPILQEIQGKFPDLSQAAAQVEIKKAFGSDEAVKFLLQMSQGVGALETNIRSVERAMRTGTAVTEEMARTMNLDIGARFKLLGQRIGNLAEILGRTLLPVVIPVLEGISRVIVFIQDLARSVPGLTRVVLTLSIGLGAVLTVVGGVIAAAGAIGLMLPAIKAGLAAMGAALAGVGSAVAAYLLPVVAIIGGVVLAVYLLKKAWETNFGGMRDALLGAWNKITLVFSGIRELIASLTGGTGRMSAALAGKLEQAGLMGLVVAVFRVYYRVRRFLAGLQQAFSNAFNRIRAILEPPVRALVDAFGSLFAAIGSVTRIFSVAADSADASAFQTLGAVLGAVLGVVAQIGAHLLKFVVYGLVAVIEIVAAVVRGFVWLGKAVVTALVEAGGFLFKFFLPLRLLVGALRMVGRIVVSLWRVLSGDLSVLDGLKAVGRAVVDFLAAPFRWARDVVAGLWGFIRGLFGSIGRYVAAAAASLFGAFVNLPLVQTLAEVFGAVGSLLSTDTTFFEAGKRILIALGEGIWSAVGYPFELLKKALGRLRSLLPFSDAESGPLSNLTASGAAIPKTLAQGMVGALGLPGAILGRVLDGLRAAIARAWQGLRSLGASAMQAVAAPFSRIADAGIRAWDRITRTAATAWRGLRSGAQQAGEWIKASFEGLATAASSAWSRVKSGAGGAWDSVASSVADLAQRAVESGQVAIAALTRGSALPASVSAGTVASATLPLSHAGARTGEGVGERLHGLLAPLRLVVQGLRTVKHTADTLWQGLAGDIAALDGLQAIGRAVVYFLATPFRWAEEIIAGVWNRLRAGFSNVGTHFRSAAAALLDGFRDLPLASTFAQVSSAVRSFLSGDTTFFETGRGILAAIGQGIRSAATFPFELLRRALERLRDLLPFSGAAAGTISAWMRSGSAVLTALAGGMSAALVLPVRVLGRAFDGVLAAIRTGWEAVESLGASAMAAVTAPFRGIAEGASQAWSRITATAAQTWIGLRAAANRAGTWMKAPFEGLAAVASSVFAQVEGSAEALWPALAQGMSVLDELKGAWAAVGDFLGTPFLHVREVIVNVWGVLRALFSAVGRFLTSAAAAVVRAFMDLPLVQSLTEAFSTVKRLLAGDTTFLEAGRHILVTLGRGIALAESYPFERFKQVLARLRSLLPFSDAETGPLSNLTASGAAILTTLAQGMAGVIALPGAVLVQAFEGVLGAAREGWRRLQALGTSAVAAVAGSFQGIADAATLAWSRITTTAGGAWNGLRTMTQNVVAWIRATFDSLPAAASSAWARVKSAGAGAWEGVASGISGLTRTAAKGGKAVLASAGGGSNLLEKLAGGIVRAATIPGRAMADAFAWMNQAASRIAAPTMLSGTLALTPVLAEQVPQPRAPVLGPEPAVRAVRPAAAPAELSRLLAETRGALAPVAAGASGEPAREDVGALLNALIGKLDALADRPIEVSVTSQLDGRQVAQSVYRDIRERKVRNYETL